MTDDPFSSAERYFCHACDCGQGITRDASPYQREMFNRFVIAHEQHNADVVTAKRLRITVPRKFR